MLYLYEKETSPFPLVAAIHSWGGLILLKISINVSIKSVAVTVENTVYLNFTGSNLSVMVNVGC